VSYYEQMNKIACSDEDKQKHTLIINRSNSRCGNCNRGASTEQRIHDTIYEYSPDTGAVGCGTEFRYVASDYFGLGSFWGGEFETTEELYAHMYPDLEWNGFDERKMREEMKQAYDNR